MQWLPIECCLHVYVSQKINRSKFGGSLSCCLVSRFLVLLFPPYAAGSGKLMKLDLKHLKTNVNGNVQTISGKAERDHTLRIKEKNYYLLLLIGCSLNIIFLLIVYKRCISSLNNIFLAL